MKVYLAKDWRGCHVYDSPPSLLKNLPSFPPTWSGHELKECDINGSFVEDEIPRGEFIVRNIFLIYSTLKLKDYHNNECDTYS